jgi:hypothetical protein
VFFTDGTASIEALVSPDALRADIALEPREFLDDKISHTLGNEPDLFLSAVTQTGVEEVQEGTEVHRHHDFGTASFREDVPSVLSFDAVFQHEGVEFVHLEDGR